MGKQFSIIAASVVFTFSLAYAQSPTSRNAGNKFDFEKVVSYVSSPAFRKMSYQDQKTYIEDLRAFVIALENVDLGSTKKSRKLDVWFEFLRRTQNEAEANSSNCRVTRGGPGGNQYCYWCQEFGQIPDTSNPGVKGSICRGTPELVLREVNDPQSPFPKTNVTIEQLRQVDDNSGERYAPIQSTITKREGVVVVKDTPAGTAIYRVPDDGRPLVRPSEAEPGTAIERTRSDGTTEVVANRVGEKLIVQPNEEQLRTARAEEDLKKLRENFRGNLRCIYAGFPIEGNTCEGKTEFKLDNGKNLSCKATKDEGDTVAAAKPDPKKTILCNPLLFGLDQNSKPLCIAKSKNASKDCDKLAKATPGSLEKTRELQANSRNESKKIGWTLAKLCQGDPAQVKAFLKERGSRDAEKSYRDIQETCKTFGDRFSSYWRQFDSPSEQRRGRN